MTEQEVMIAEKVLGLLSNSSMKVVESYSSWFVYSALIWIIIASVCIYFSFKTIKASRILYEQAKANGSSDTNDIAFFYWASWLLLVISIFVIGGNLPDLLASDAAAIHQILKDIK